MPNQIQMIRIAAATSQPTSGATSHGPSVKDAAPARTPSAAATARRKRVEAPRPPAWPVGRSSGDVATRGVRLPGTGFEVKPTLDGTVLATLALPLWFERPDPLVFEGRTGARGPGVEVVADPYPGRLLLTARPDGGAPFLAILARRDAAGFRLVSRGGAGTAGSSGYRGSDGVTGAAGTPASCPGSPGGTGGQGGSGGRGGDGGPGGRGGDGGEVSVELRCRGDGCDELTGLLRVIVQSEGGAGGPGGPGGSGGSGGSGGMGGSGTSCYAAGHTSYVSGGGTGARGSDGSAGNNGMPGPRGADGSVALRRTP